MPSDSKPLGQQYHEAVESLKASGMKNAEAIREVATRFGKQENAIRGGIHQWKARHDSAQPSAAPSSRSQRAATTTVDSLLASARKSLEEALSLVDREVHHAKTALDQAQAHYDQVVSGVKDKKADIEQKLKALK
jgi:chromosome segregation ATPase